MSEFTGLLWFDNANVSLDVKIKRALTVYEGKHLPAPELCMVSMKDIQGLDLEALSLVCNITVIGSRLVLQNHLWIGQEKELQGMPK